MATLFTAPTKPTSSDPFAGVLAPPTPVLGPPVNPNLPNPSSLSMEQKLLIMRTPSALDEAKATWGSEWDTATQNLGNGTLDRNATMEQVHSRIGAKPFQPTAMQVPQAAPAAPGVTQPTKLDPFMGVLAPAKPELISSGIDKLNLTPQENFLYQHHVDNLNNGLTTSNPDGSYSSVKQAVVGIGGKFYNIPTIWDGKELSVPEAMARAQAQGLENWPSYNSPQEADARYAAMHQFMEKDQPMTALERTLGITPQQKIVVDYFYNQAQQNMQDNPIQNEGSLVRGLYSAALGVKSTLYGIRGIEMKILGNPEGMRDAFDTVMLAQAQADMLAPKYNTVEGLIQNGSLGDFLSWAGYNLGQQGANMASTVLAGGGGAFVGKTIAQLEAKHLIDQNMAKALIGKYVEKGAMLGALANTTAMESANTATEQYGATGDVNPAIALGAGLVKGILEEQTPLVLAGRIGLTPKMGSKLYNQIFDKMLQGGFIRRTAGGVVTTALAEGSTEAAQEIVDIAARKFVDENYDVLGPDAASRVLNSAAVGTLLGGFFGLPSGVFPHGGNNLPPPEQLGASDTAAVTPEGIPLTKEGVQNDINAPLPVEQLNAMFTANPTPGVTEGPVQGPVTEATPASQPVVQTPGGATVNIAPGSNVNIPPGAGQPPDVVQPTAIPKVPEAIPPSESTATATKAPVIHPALLALPASGAELPPANSPAGEKNRILFLRAISFRNAAQIAIAKGDNVRATALLQQAMNALNRGLGKDVNTIVPAGTPVTPGALGPLLGKAPPQTPAATAKSTQASGLAGLNPNVAGKAIPTMADGILKVLNMAPGGRSMLDIMRILNVPASASQSTQNEIAGYFADWLNKGLIEEIPNPGGGTGERVKYNLTAKGRQDLPAPGPVGPRSIGTDIYLDTHGVATITSDLPPRDYQHAFDRLKPGQVQVIRGKADPNTTMDRQKWEAEWQRQAERFLKDIVSRLLPKMKLIVNFANAPRAPGYGVFYGGANNLGVISINLAKADTPANATLTLAHELGHAVMHSEFRNAGADVQGAIHQEWLNMLRKNFGQKDASLEDFAMDFYSPTMYSELVAGYGANRMTEPSSVFFGRSGTNIRWLSFDEYMAEQVARWFSSAETPRTLVDKFFKGLGTKILAVMQAMGLVKERFQAAPEVAKWLQSLIDRSKEGLPSLSGPAALGGINDGIASNAKAMGTIPDLYHSPPPQPETIPIRRGAPSFGISKKQVAQIDKFSWWKKTTWSLLQLADVNRHIGGLQRYTELIRQWHNEKMQLVSRADQHLRKWRRLGKEQSQNLSNFLYAMDRMEYLPPGANARWPTTPELVALAQKYNLNRGSVGMYFIIRDDFLDVLARIEKAWIRDANAITDPVARQIALNKVAAEMGQLRSSPYFPHERFGDYAVTVRDAAGKTVHFSMHRTVGEQKRAGADAMKHFGPGHSVVEATIPEDMRIFRGVPPMMLKKIASQLNLSVSQKGWLDKMVFELSPANSFAKRMLRRKNTAGFSMDAMRNYASYFLHAGSHIARLEYSEELQAAVRDVRDSALAPVPGQRINRNKRAGIADWMSQHYEYIMNPPDEWLGLRSLTFLWYLAFNVSSAMTNLTQVPMVTAPYLAARHGDVAALNELRRAYADLRKLYTLKQGKLPPDEIEAIRMGVEQGFLDEAQAMELAAVADNGTLLRFMPGSVLQRSRMMLGYYGAFLFQAAEKLNRRVSFRASYRLAKNTKNTQYLDELQTANPQLYNQLIGAGWTHQNARAFLAARDAVERTQFEYARWARPNFMRGKKGTLFTFYSFMQNMLWFYKNSPGAKRALVLLLVAAGPMGLPFADDLKNVLRLLVREVYGKDFNMETELRQFAHDLGANPDIFAHGLGRESFGLKWVGDQLGIPIPGFDFSARLGLGRIIPGLEPATDNTLDPDTRLSRIAQDVGGPTYNIPYILYKALASNNPDKFKEMEKALPTTAKNFARAIRYLERGGEQTNTGAELMQIDPLDMYGVAEIAGQMIGLTPTRVAQAWDNARAKKEIAAYWMMRRQEIFAEHDMARRSKDREGLADLKEALAAYNAAVPDPKMRITQGDLMASFRKREEQRRKLEQGQGQQQGLQGVNKELNQLYPQGKGP